MNIVTPILTALAFPTANLNTESARRDNTLRETIPQTSDAEQGASQKGLGSDTDKARTPGQPPAPVTYERPQVQSELQAAFDNVFGQEQDNAEDESAGKQNAQDQQQSQQQSQQQTEQEQQEIASLEARDEEVRTHEQAHAVAGGQYAGTPQYEYTTGPDNKRYITDGKVSIDISEAQTPEQTLSKMQQVRTAALAPAQPSAQDLKVAAEASQKAFEARAEIAEEKAEESGQALASEGSSSQSNGVSITPPSLNDITDNTIEPPTRSLDDAVLSAQEAAKENSEKNAYAGGARSLDFGEAQEISPAMAARVGRIQNVYTQAYTPASQGFSASA